MINIKQIGKSSDLYDPLDMEVLTFTKGERWIVNIRKSALKNKCQGEFRVLDCKGEDCNIKKVYSKPYNILYADNDESAYLTMTINNKDNIPEFVINVKESDEYIDLFEFEGGDFNDLIETIQSFNLGLEPTPYGIIIYFDKKYHNKEAIIEGTDQLYLLNDFFCLKNNKNVSISFSLDKVGSFRVVFMDGEEIIAASNKINVVDFIPRNTYLLEFHEDGFYNRYRTELIVSEPQSLIEESEKVLSSGRLYIYDTTIRNESIFYTPLLTTEQATGTISLLKSGVKLDGKSVMLRGSLTKVDENISKRATYSGVLLYLDDFVYNGEDCQSSCDSDSAFSYQINGEIDKVVLNNI